MNGLHHKNGRKSAGDGLAETWRSGYENPNAAIDPKATILRDGKLLINPNSEQDHLSRAKLLHRTCLMIQIITRCRIGLLHKLTELARNFDCTIIGCESERLTLSQRLSKQTSPTIPLFEYFAKHPLNETLLMLTGEFDALRQCWNELEKLHTLPEFYKEPPSEFALASIEACGPDKLGVLESITKVLWAHGVNTRSLSARTRYDFNELNPLATAYLTMELPLGCGDDKLKKDLEETLPNWKFTLANVGTPLDL